MNLTVCPSRGPGSIPSGVFQGIFPWLITLCQPVLSQCAWQKMAQSPLNGTTEPVDIPQPQPVDIPQPQPVDIEEEG